MHDAKLDTRKRKQLFYTYFGYMLAGMLALSVGSLIPLIRDARGIDYAFAGLMLSMHSAGNLISGFLAGPAAVRFGRKKAILIFDVSYFLAYGLIILGRNKYVLLLAFLLTGLARGASSNFCNTTINNLDPGNAVLMNVLHAAFSFGAFLFPVILMVITRWGQNYWIYAAWFMLIMGVLSFLSYLIMPVDEFVHKTGEAGEDERTDTSKEGDKRGGAERAQKRSRQTNAYGFFREPLFYLCLFTAFFYLCAEQGVMGWLVSYFRDTGLLDAGLAQVMAGLQWVMVLAGRLLVAYLSTKLDKSKLLRMISMLMLFFFVVLVVARTPVQIVAGVVGFGLSMAGVYPTTVSFSGDLIQKYPMAWSFLLSCASIGSIIMPSIIGSVAEVAGILTGMSTVVAVIVMDTILVFAMTTYVKRKK